VNRGKAFN